MKTLQKKLLFFLLILPLGILAQSTLKGTVLDGANSSPLPGANIIVEGSKNGTTTDFDGKFTISNIKTGDVITISYIGYKDQKITFNNQNDISITLQEDSKELKDVVVIGYGTVKKKDATGAVNVVASKDFNKGAVVSGSDLLNGKIAGVTINAGGGSPGSIGEIRIRGGSSLNANNDPLVVVDGLPMTDPGILNRINPNDIESFSILKDASATAIYGTRASNGVIMITTKKGGKELEVDYNVQYGTGKHFNTIDVLNANEFKSAINYAVDQGLYGSAAFAPYTGNSNTNWQEEIYRRTDFIDNNLSLRGSLFNRIPTRLSVGNTLQEGLLLTDKMNRNSVSLSINPTFFDNHLKLNVNANFTQTNRRNAPFVVPNALKMDPTQPVYNPNSPFGGFFEFMNPGSDPSNINNFAPISVTNPVAQLFQTNNRSSNERLFGNIELDYKFHFFPSLRWVTKVGFDRDSGFSRNSTSRFARTSPQFNNQFVGNNSYSDGESTNELLDSYFVYSNNKNEKFIYDVTLGYSYQKFESNGRSTGNINNPNNITPPNTIAEPKVYIGFIGRANFTYNDKYLLTLSYRRDGTSRFSEDNRWGNFPAASFAWKVKEDLFSESTKISDLKLRLGWGVTGQQDIGFANSSLIYLPQYLLADPNSSYSFGDNFINPSIPQGYNPLIRWEETTTYNAGFDFGFFNNRLNGSLDGFMKKSQDLLQIAPFADGTNFTNEGPQNFGSMTVTGFELNLNYDVIKNDKLKWNVNFNASKFERRIDEMPAGADQLIGDLGFGLNAQVNRVNFTPGSFLVFKQLYDQNNRPIEGAFADLNGDKIINENDRYVYRNGDPDFTLGFTSSFNYNNFDFSFNLRANIGNRIYNYIEARNSFYSDILNGTPQNLHTQTVNNQFNTYTGNQVLSDMFIENASFLRMDYFNVGYTFPKWLEGKASLRLFTGMQNPFIITKYNGLDPEITGGIDRSIYPRQRQVLFGANIKF